MFSLSVYFRTYIFRKIFNFLKKKLSLKSGINNLVEISKYQED